MNAARHEEVARALGARGRQDRRRELVETRLMHAPADRPRDRESLHDDVVQRLAPEVEEAIGEAQVFRIVRLAEDRDRQLLGLGQNLDLARVHLDFAGREVRVDSALRPIANEAIDPDDPFGTHGLQLP